MPFRAWEVSTPGKSSATLCNLVSGSKSPKSLISSSGEASEAERGSGCIDTFDDFSTKTYTEGHREELLCISAKWPSYSLAKMCPMNRKSKGINADLTIETSANPARGAEC